MKRKPSLLGLAILFVATVAVIVGAFLFIAKGSSASLDETLARADVAISKKEYASAKSLLNGIRAGTMSAYDRLRVVKRSYQIATLNNDARFLEKISRRMSRTLPGAEDLRAFYVESLLLQKKYAKAALFAQGLKSERFASIRAEAILSAEHPNDIEPMATVLEKLYESKNPDYYRHVAQLTRLNDLYYDAAILYMMDGNVVAAAEILAALPIDSEKNPIRAILSYDVGNFSAARELINAAKDPNAFDIVSLKADISLAERKYGEAYLFYQKAISIDPLKSAQAWMNVLLLGERLDVKTDSLDLIKNALAYFPDRKPFVLAYLIREPSAEARSALTDRFFEVAPFDPDMTIYWIDRVAKPHVSTDFFTSKLWEVYAKNLASERLARYMIWYFIGISDVDSVSRVLDYYKGEPGEWVDYYRALTLCAQGNLKAAADIWNRSSAWEAMVNKALVYRYYGDDSKAIEALLSSEAAVPADDPSRDLHLSLIKGRKAAVYFEMDNLSAMTIEANAALLLNPLNEEARKVLRQSVIQ